jgi:hypothetical protein
MTRRLAILFFFITIPTFNHASEYQILTRLEFVQSLGNRQLKRFGANLYVFDDGSIKGNVFGKNFDGIWEWKDGYFCRDFMGEKLLGYDCQKVEKNGDEMRFTAQKGEGQSLQFKLRK